MDKKTTWLIVGVIGGVVVMLLMVSCIVGALVLGWIHKPDVASSMPPDSPAVGAPVTGSPAASSRVAASHAAVQAYFVNEADANDVIVAAADQIPPFAQDGKVYVLGAFFTCTGDCKDRKLVYLQKYTREAWAAMEGQRNAGPGAPAVDPMIVERGVLVRAVDRPEWYPAMSKEGAQIMSPGPCPGGKGAPAYCVPGK